MIERSAPLSRGARPAFHCTRFEFRAWRRRSGATVPDGGSLLYDGSSDARTRLMLAVVLMNPARSASAMHAFNEANV